MKMLTCVSLIVVLTQSILHSQVTLDPATTVDPLTGEMAFSIPLASLGTVNNHDFPITLGYKSGIRVYQEASSVGLGFSPPGGGGIVRRTVFVPDDNSVSKDHDGMAKWKYDDPDGYCYESDPDKFGTWDWAILIIDIFVIIVTAFTGWGVIYVIWAGFKFGYSATATAITIISALNASPADFRSGGEHDPSYNYKEGNGLGYFWGGEDRDIPDMYFISTPYISGQLVWIGSPQTGHFVLKRTEGSIEKNTLATKIDYDKINRTFAITLRNGTKLLFERYDTYAMETEILWWGRLEDDSKCVKHSNIRNRENVPFQWHLTDVHFPDQESIHFEYTADEFADITKFCSPVNFAYTEHHVSFNSRICSYDFCPAIFHNPMYITTTRDSAVFVYADNRYDIAWKQDENEYRSDVSKKLEKIEIYTKATKELRKEITFETDYSIRNDSHCALKYFSGDIQETPGWYQTAFTTQNPSAASLCLNTVRISGAHGETAPDITFEYYDKQTNAQHVDDRHFQVDGFFFEWEARDIWGYYNPNEQKTYNYLGRESQAANWARAWSLKGISLPGGMEIEWAYEPHCFDMANGRPIADYFGGGIRVKNMHVRDGMGAEYTKSFLYQNGHVSALPKAFFKEDEYRSYEKTRGGIYVPSKVMYETVKIIDNYHEGTADPTPNGYTVYNFQAPLTPEMQNSGRYGENDNTWKWGMVNSIKVYNTDMDRPWHRLVHAREFEYDTIREYNALPYFKQVGSGTFTSPGGRIGVGCVRMRKSRQFLDGVWKETEYQYADDDAAIAEDKVSFHTEIATPDPLPSINMHIVDPLDAQYFRSGKVIRTKVFGDPNREDLVIIGRWDLDYPSYEGMILLTVASDLDNTGNPTVWSEIREIQLLDGLDVAEYGRIILGATVGNIGGGAGPDIIFTMKPYSPSLRYYNCILYDCILDGESSFFWASETHAEVVPPACTVPWNNCCFGDITTEDDQIDMVFTESGEATEKILVCVNVQSDGTILSENMFLSDALPMDCKFGWNSHYFEMMDLDGDGNKNDLVTTNSTENLGYCDKEGSSLLDAFAYKNISIDPASNMVTTTNTPFYSPEKLGYSININTGSNGFILDIAYASGYDDQYYVFCDAEIDVVSHTEYYIAKTKRTVIRDRNGTPNRIVTTNSDGAQSITALSPAYCQYPSLALDAHHRLVEPYKTMVYRDAVDDANVVRAGITTYAAHSNWLPHESLIWRVSPDASGVLPPYQDYWENDEPWILGKRIVKYGPYTTVAEMHNDLQVAASRFYTDPHAFPAATVQNAPYDNCAVYTCDYGHPTDPFIDRIGLWERGLGSTSSVCELRDTKPHFGKKNVYVNNAYGPTKNIYVTPGNGYIFSAWVFPVSENPIMFAVEVHINNAPEQSGAHSCHFLAEKLVPNTWQKVRHLISAEMLHGIEPDPSNGSLNDYVRIWVGNAPPSQMQPTEFYIEDIRFYPADALVTTHYYDYQHGVSRVTLDANANPGKKSVYDGFGRLEGVYRISNTDESMDEMVLHKEYHWHAP